MQSAVDSQGRPVVAWEAARGEAYACPECGEPVHLKAGARVVEHFAHRPGADCALSEGESRRHLAMKKQMGLLLAGMGCAVRCEAVLGGRRADLLAGAHLAVECQESPIRVEEVEARTGGLNAAGCGALWVWDLPRLCLGSGARRFADLSESREYAVAAEVRAWHRESYGRVYVLDDDGSLMACHLEPAALRLTDGGPEGRWADRRPTTRRHLSLHSCGSRVRSFTGSQAHLALAGFSEGVWWTVSEAAGPRPGHVAVVRCGGLHLIECVPEPSLRSLRRSAGMAPGPPLTAVHYIAAADMVGARDALRRRFAGRRIGDTSAFRLTAEDLEALLAVADLKG